jgi:hypothetical protein
MRRLLTSAAVLFLLVIATRAQEIRVISAPDTSAILIGDRTGFTVTAEIPAGLSAEMITAGDTLAGKIVVLGRDPRDTTRLDGGVMRITDRYLITSFDSGTYEIPPFYAERISGDSLIRYYSEYSSLRVLRPDIVLQDTTDVIFDIVPPRTAPVTFSEVLPWIIIALIAAALVYLLARFLPRNPLKRFVKPVPPPEPAHIIALRELKTLREGELWQKGEVKEYYSRLSDILRRYIDNRYGISSPELTTDETVRMLQRAAVTTSGQMGLVKEVLSLSDMVKFAKYVPEAVVHETSYGNAERFVEETREAELIQDQNKPSGTPSEHPGTVNRGTATEKGGKNA